MRKYSIVFILGLLSTSLSLHAQCTNLTPSMTNSNNKSCGLPVTYTFTNTSTGSSSTIGYYHWIVDGAFVRRDTGKKSFRLSITQPGTYSVKMVAYDTGSTPCIDSSVTSITRTSLIPSIIDNTGGTGHNPQWENCLTNPNAPDTFGLVFQVSDSLKNYKIYWDDSLQSVDSGNLLLSSQSLYFKYTKLGVYNVHIISTVNGCTDTIVGRVINERNPVASLQGPPTGQNFGCVPYTTRFVNTTSYASPATTFSWDMGDGNTITLPSTTFNDTLWYTYRSFVCNGTVTLTASNACGASSSTWNPIQMSDKDSAIITLQNPGNCDLSVPFNFQNTSQNRYCVTPNPKKYKFLWGDGTQSAWTTNFAAQSKTYAARGVYTITLIDSNSCGKDTGTYILSIDTVPVAALDAFDTVGCAPLTVNFADLSSGNITSRLWNFGDPSSGSNTSTDSSTTHTYATSGTFTARLTVSNSCGNASETVQIRTRPKVKASFPPLPNGCVPHKVILNNTSTEVYQGTTYRWILPDGTVSTQRNPDSFFINAPGLYTVKLIATDSCGTDSFQRTIPVFAAPTFNVTKSKDTLCPFEPVNITFNSNVNTTTIVWDFDDQKQKQSFVGGASYNYSYSFDTGKVYMAKAVLTDTRQCMDSFNVPFVVMNKPRAGFSLSLNDGCAPVSPVFNNSSLNNNPNTYSRHAYSWSANGVFFDTASNPTYSFPGSNYVDSIYHIKLNVVNSFNCRDSISDTLIVYPKPLSSFVQSLDTSCGPVTIAFTNESSPKDTGSIDIMQFEWGFGNGYTSNQKDTSIRFISGLAGDSIYVNGLISTSEHGCKDTSYRTLYIYPKPIVTFTTDRDSGCTPLPVQLSNQSNPLNGGVIGDMTFRWNFGNGNTSSAINPFENFNNGTIFDTTFTIKLLGYSEHRCVDSFTRDVKIFRSTKNNIVPGDTAGCNGFRVDFNGTAINGVSNYWFINNTLVDTTQSYSSQFFGKTLEDSLVIVRFTSSSSDNCSGDTSVRIVTIKNRPIAEFSPKNDSVCRDLPIQFLNESLGAASYAWDFGDGNILSTINPKILLPKSYDPVKDSVYTITLIANTVFGCADTFSSPITIYPYPIAHFTLDTTTSCEPFVPNIVNLSQNSTRWEWNFSSGESSNLFIPNKKAFITRGYADTSFFIQLLASTLNCTDTFEREITVYPTPISFFTVDRTQPCSNDYQFFNYSEGEVAQTYYFGDGTTDTGRTPLHTYKADPFKDTIYNPSLIVTSNFGCKDTFQRRLVVPQHVEMGFQDTTVIACPPYTHQFRNSTRGGISHIWDFGDGSGSSDYNPRHTYIKPGTYNYSIKSTDATGCTDSLRSNGTITILVKPTANFTYAPLDLRAGLNTTVDFTDRSTSAVPITYQWNFMDPYATPASNNFSTLQNPSYTYTDSGTFNAQLVVYNGACYDTASREIVVEPPLPVVTFTDTLYKGCAPFPVQFSISTQHTDSVKWDFGDGDTSTQFNPLHTYANPGLYDVSVLAIGIGGTRRFYKFSYLQVYGQPFAYFDVGPNNVFQPNAYIFSENFSQRAVRYEWYVFKEPGKNLVYTFNTKDFDQVLTDTGLYSFMLIAYNNEECFDTFYRENYVFVNPAGKIYTPNAFAPDGDDRNDIFKPSVVNVRRDEYYFSIYNRWGEKVFDTRNPDEGWDGTYKGKPCQADVYVYKLNAYYLNGEEHTDNGVIHLLR